MSDKANNKQGGVEGWESGCHESSVMTEETVKVSIAGSRIMRLFNEYDVYGGEACYHFVTKGSKEKVPEGLTPGSEIDFIASIGRVSYHKPTLFILGEHRLIKLSYSITPPMETRSVSFNKMVALLQDAGMYIPNLSDEAIQELVSLHSSTPSPDFVLKQGWKIAGEPSKLQPVNGPEQVQPEGEYKPYIQPVGWPMFITVGLLGVIAGALIGLAFS